MSSPRNLPDLPDLAVTKEYLKGFNFFEKYVHGQWEGDLYVETHIRRFHETLALLPELPQPRVLELGAVPYYLTILLKRFYSQDVDTLSFFEFEESQNTTHAVENLNCDERYEFEYRALNVERELFPFLDDQYDVVLCCELLEHLLINPSHMLYETHRVLRPGGYLLLSTPNVLRWGNFSSLLLGRNIYDSYHGNGIYGRHNREYSMVEVGELLEANGFQIEWLGTRSVYGPDLYNRVPLILDNRRDNIFALARTTGSRKMAFPQNLYTLVDEHRNVVRSSIEMGIDDTGQIGRGWHQFESGEPGFRWTGKSAKFYLKGEGMTRINLKVCSHSPKITERPLVISLHANGTHVGTADLTSHEWQELSFGLPDCGPLFSCEIEVSETWTPKVEKRTEDTRELGIAVARVWMQ